MHTLQHALVSLAALAAVAWGYEYETVCGPMDNHMFAALGALGKTPVQLRFPGSIPYPDKPAGVDSIPGIEHIVWLMMENHSWDNIYGLLNRSGQDGFPLDSKTGEPITLVPQKYNNGSVQLLYEMPNSCGGVNNGPSQNWQSSHQQFNNGSMDGFAVGGEQDKPQSFGYFTPRHLPFMHSLGEQFALNDRFFCSLLGQTWPNRMYALGASSRGVIATGQTDAVAAATWPTGIIFNTLDAHNISWTAYSNGTSTLELFPNITSGFPATKFRDFPYSFMSDAKQGNLSAFNFIDYNATVQSMECPENVVFGDQLQYDVVKALMTGPQWNKTLLIINFDEHGGFYDHVPPVPAIAPDNVLPVIPAADIAKGYYQYSQYRKTGFRVPLIMVSPYAKKDYISHVVHEQTSVLSLLEHKYNLPALSCRDANANNFYDMIDFDALESQKPNFPDMKSVGLVAPSYDPVLLSCTTANPGVLPPPGSVVYSAGNLTTAGPDFSPKCEIV
ncbi:hypothetical protein PV11_03034 [Exophiala sideris]|uniref:Phospholipase C n=1 Tax=Exophiala sideris TaxID=1016849 RepID=A0A0D1YY51_9EURO|nr:hypothetical protein PV11_03034 [Exophiala sideris]